MVMARVVAFNILPSIDCYNITTAISLGVTLLSLKACLLELASTLILHFFLLYIACDYSRTRLYYGNGM